MSQSEKDKYYNISLMWNLRNKTKGKERGKQRNRFFTVGYKLMVTGGEMRGLGKIADED